MKFYTFLIHLVHIMYKFPEVDESAWKKIVQVAKCRTARLKLKGPKQSPIGSDSGDPASTDVSEA